MNKINKQSPNLQDDVITKLKQAYPPLFDDEGNFDKEELQNLMKGFASTTSGKYEFNWAGKMSAKRNAYKISRANLKPDKKRSIDFDTTENLIIEGENLEVLKLLQKSYFNKVKVIYIDPPYNTGKDFIYSDNFTEGKQAYWEQNGTTAEGVKMDTNTESQGRYHSNWLNMIYPRLLLARNLLKEDGVIFVSIDDNEIANLRKMMDEVFGEENFVGEMIWEKKYTTSNNIIGISDVHEYILVYGKNHDKAENSINKLPYTEEARKRYKNPDNDPKGDWMDVSYHGPKSPTERPNLNYPIVRPSDGKEIWPKEKSWAYEKKSYEEHVAEKRFWWGVDGNYAEPRLKKYFSEMQDGGIIPKTLLNYKLVGTTSSGRSELRDIFGQRESGVMFDNSKPSTLINHLLKIGSNDDSVILDFFAGSGTTAHAVMDLNKEDLAKGQAGGGNRKYILVQIPEETDKKSEAYKAGYKTISDICIERVKRVSEKIKNENDGKLLKDNPNLDLGFKVFSLTKSYFPENLFAPDPDKTDSENTKAFEEYLKKAIKQLEFEFDENFLIYEVLLKDGFELNFKSEQLKEFKKNKVLKVSDGIKEALICLDVKLDDSTLELLSKYKDNRFICLERAVDTTKKWNLKKMFGRNLWVA